jgi:hypothetical protein
LLLLPLLVVVVRMLMLMMVEVTWLSRVSVQSMAAATASGGLWRSSVGSGSCSSSGLHTDARGLQRLLLLERGR